MQVTIHNICALKTLNTREDYIVFVKPTEAIDFCLS